MKVWLARMQVGSTASLPLYSTQVSKTANKAISNPPGHISLLLCSNESIKKKKKKNLLLNLQLKSVMHQAPSSDESSHPDQIMHSSQSISAPSCPTHQACAEQSFQSSFSSELKNLFCQVTKERWLL